MDFQSIQNLNSRKPSGLIFCYESRPESGKDGRINTESIRHALCGRSYSPLKCTASQHRRRRRVGVGLAAPEEEDDGVPTSGISRLLPHILEELNKRIPDSLVRTRVESGFSVKCIPWHIVNRVMNLHAPEWSGEVRSITYSADGKSVSVVYRVTLYCTNAEGVDGNCIY